MDAKKPVVDERPITQLSVSELTETIRSVVRSELSALYAPRKVGATTAIVRRLEGGAASGMVSRGHPAALRAEWQHGPDGR